MTAARSVELALDVAAALDDARRNLINAIELARSVGVDEATIIAALTPVLAEAARACAAGGAFGRRRPEASAPAPVTDEYDQRTAQAYIDRWEP